MAQTPDKKRAEALGLAVATLTLSRFTPKSVTEFLSGVATVAQEKIAPRQGPPPGFPVSTPITRAH